MFRSTDKLTIIPIGYEHTIPEFAQYQHHAHIQRVLKNLRHAPDFALISQDKTNVFLVEVKYRKELIDSDILEIADKLIKKSNPCFIFIATQDNFYFESCNEIIRNSGRIKILNKNWIPHTKQHDYFLLLNEFIRS